MTPTPSEAAGRAATCANWQRTGKDAGWCQRCGVPWQDWEVGQLYRCDYYTPAPEAKDRPA